MATAILWLKAALLSVFAALVLAGCDGARGTAARRDLVRVSGGVATPVPENGGTRVDWSFYLTNLGETKQEFAVSVSVVGVWTPGRFWTDRKTVAAAAGETVPVSGTILIPDRHCKTAFRYCEKCAATDRHESSLCLDCRARKIAWDATAFGDDSQVSIAATLGATEDREVMRVTTTRVIRLEDLHITTAPDRAGKSKTEVRIEKRLPLWEPLKTNAGAKERD